MDKKKFKVLFINSPSTSISKVELPGDPVSILYATRELFNSIKNNYFKSEIKPEIIKFQGQPIYDPRIWNDKTKKEFRELLKKNNPSAIFFCAYSPSHPYALEMAKEIKKNNRDSLIVFGGKHQDETLYYLPGKKKIKMTACNTINLIYNKKNLLWWIWLFRDKENPH